MERFAMGARVRSGVATGVWLLCAALLLLSAPAEAKRRSTKAGGWAPPQSAMVLDPVSGKVLYGLDVDGQRHPASLTKVMTLYLLFEQIEKGAMKLDTPLQVSYFATTQAPSRLGVKKGETISVDDAIKAIVTRSANDVAVVIAENLAGTEKAFAEKMTEKAQELGMRNTLFVNASGLPNKQQITTARDLALLGKAVRERFPDLFGYFATKSFEYAGAKVPSHNRLMNRLEGMDGIKTGFTNASGFNLLASVRRGDRSVIAVVMGGTTQKSRDDKMAELVNRTIGDAAPAPVLVAGAAKDAPLAYAASAPLVFPPQTASVAKPAARPEPLPGAATAATPAASSALIAAAQVPAKTVPATSGAATNAVALDPAAAPAKAVDLDPVTTASIMTAPAGGSHMPMILSVLGALALGCGVVARRRFGLALPGSATLSTAGVVARVVAVHVRETAAETAVGSRIQVLTSNIRNRAPWPRRSPAAIGASLPAMDMASAGPANEAATAGPWMPPGAIR
ncbi:hypothetical protein GCM10007036_19340 [Alsobacter metallidurans]|uniref:Peptidase S11 D-alanyl-D-alanine carboxypeptidase A N-terminal domain-containing protein n=1 Tax=Alsobacter metallidurans TaxID=340221 RepID=A0A917I7I8_9HYPH|nr:D-alanyl-D-alanine carboxypeptidase family protein [Alsobacter metallidurans]GGH17702.1 hypothetical protein GCM10007036_19340 [Alsobacter metallidurans]